MASATCYPTVVLGSPPGRRCLGKILSKYMSESSRDLLADSERECCNSNNQVGRRIARLMLNILFGSVDVDTDFPRNLSIGHLRAEAR